MVADPAATPRSSLLPVLNLDLAKSFGGRGTNIHGEEDGARGAGEDRGGPRPSGSGRLAGYVRVFIKNIDPLTAVPYVESTTPYSFEVFVAAADEERARWILGLSSHRDDPAVS